MFSRFFMPRVRGGSSGSKKRYAGVHDGALEIVGTSCRHGPEGPPPLVRAMAEPVASHQLFQAGQRAVDVSGELMGDLFTQGREIAVFKAWDPLGFMPNQPNAWGPQVHKGHIFFSDFNSGLWAVKLQPKTRPVSE